MAKSTIYDIYADLVNALKTFLESKYIFLKDRPNIKEGDVPMQRFVVVDLPISIRDTIIGNSRTMLESNGVIYAFVQARSNKTLDLNPMGTFVDSICGLFPIKGECCVATNPIIQLKGSDGQDFQTAAITFDLRTRMNVFSE